jgi:hypothetical protein
MVQRQNYNLKARRESNCDFTNERITVEADPWVRPETVEAVFREARRRAEGRKNRPVGEKNLKLFRFVLRRSNPIGKLKDGSLPNVIDISNSDEPMSEKLIENLEYQARPEGRKLVEEWNRSDYVKKNPSWAYSPEDSRILLRDYRRTLRAVAYTARLDRPALAEASPPAYRMSLHHPPIG